MNKRSVRSFGFGMLISVCVLGAAFYRLDTQKNEKETISIVDAKKILKKNNYLIYSQEEFKTIKSDIQLEAEKKQTTSNNKEQKTEASTTKTIISYHLEIVDGMNSTDIVDRLATAEVISEPKKLQNYLDKKGYSTKIQLGTFILTNEMSMEQIAKTITKS